METVQDEAEAGAENDLTGLMSPRRLLDHPAARLSRHASTALVWSVIGSFVLLSGFGGFGEFSAPVPPVAFFFSFLFGTFSWLSAANALSMLREDPGLAETNGMAVVFAVESRWGGIGLVVLSLVGALLHVTGLLVHFS